MSRKSLHLLFLSAWLVASGGLWDLVQVAAWTGMFATRLETMPVLAAAQQTFQPEEKCHLCRAVEDGKRAQDKSAGTIGGDFSSKAPIIFQALARLSVIPSPAVATVRVKSGFACYRRETPPLPPPRV
ncbi:MAG: hypothetical protein WDM96_06890 [Lacunisphaera sp.]